MDAGSWDRCTVLADGSIDLLLLAGINTYSRTNTEKGKHTLKKPPWLAWPLFFLSLLLPSKRIIFSPFVSFLSLPPDLTVALPSPSAINPLSNRSFVPLSSRTISHQPAS